MRMLTVSLLIAGCLMAAKAENFKCTTEFPEQAACDPETCLAKNDCSCFSAEPNITLRERPQIVYLTFDDGFTKLAHDNYYEKLFQGAYKNPNGCNIRATHFLTHKSTDYTLVNKYYALGHEMASHSITHRSNTTYWRLLNEQGWIDEMDGMRQIISSFGKVPLNKITGMRVPYLQSGGDTQFAMIAHSDFVYDCSRPSQDFGYINLENGVWPFTMDYQIDMSCQIEPCPDCSFKGVWVQPMLDLEDNWFDADGDPEFGNPCAMLDSCIIPESEDPEDVFNMLKRNFDKAYNGNTRAPFGLYMHAAWFFGQDFRFEGYQKFLDYILAYPDVWVVPVEAGLEYMKDPKTNDELTNKEFPPFNCDSFPKADCTSKKNCNWFVKNEDIPGETVYMNLCGSKCPVNYPWLGNPTGA